MHVKICGITNLPDAEHAAGKGAWAIGLVHHSASPRACDPGEAATIGAALRRHCEVVGVFVNPSLDEVARAVENASLTMVQLHGEEGPSFCTEVARKTGAKVVKAVHVWSAADVHSAEAFRTDFHLFDRRSGELRGGTGKTFDWELVGKRRSRIPAILSGGLTPENIGAAIRISRPFAVDVASGVEASPGLKDHGRVASFIYEAGRAGSRLEPGLGDGAGSRAGSS